MKQPTIPALTAFAVGVLGLAAPASAQTTPYPPMLRGDTVNTSQGWETTPLITIGESRNGFTPTGILDGLGAFPGPGNTIYVLANSELGANVGYSYTLANGTAMTGARIHSFQVARRLVSSMPKFAVLSGGPAYDTVYDRFYLEVTDPAQINETGSLTDGFARFCSGMSVQSGSYGFVDPIYFTGEETSSNHGGSLWALDVRDGAIWAVPQAGRMAWENVTPLDTGDPSKVALLCGDDDEANPLYLYVGEKNAVNDGSFLDRNGLKVGKLYAFKADNGDTSPEQFNGLNSFRTGTWVQVTAYNPAMANQPGYDAQGYADIVTLHDEADLLGCMDFSRPEDLATNPLNGAQAVFNSTGRGSIYPSDEWGIIYVVEVNFANLTAELVIIHDADGLAVPDAGIRSPDNLEWAQDGKIYVQEDRSTNLFGLATGIEASIWSLDPITRVFTRIAEVDRSVVAPVGSTDSGVGTIGHWETSGIIDVTHLLPHLAGERLMLTTVQAHGIRDGLIGGNANLAEGGQIVVLSKR